MTRLLANLGEVEKPQEVVNHHEDAGRDKGDGGETDERPVSGEVLEIDKVAEDREYGVRQRKRIGEIQQSV